MNICLVLLKKSLTIAQIKTLYLNTFTLNHKFSIKTLKAQFLLSGKIEIKLMF